MLCVFACHIASEHFVPLHEPARKKRRKHRFHLKLRCISFMDFVGIGEAKRGNDAGVNPAERDGMLTMEGGDDESALGHAKPKAGE